MSHPTMSQTYQANRCPRCGKPRLHDEPVCGNCRNRWPTAKPPAVAAPARPAGPIAKSDVPVVAGTLAIIGVAFVWWIGHMAMVGYRSVRDMGKPHILPAPPAQAAAYVPPPPGEVHAIDSSRPEASTDLSAYQSAPSDEDGRYVSGYHSERRVEDGVARTEHVSGYYRKDGTLVHSYSRRSRR